MSRRAEVIVRKHSSQRTIDPFVVKERVNRPEFNRRLSPIPVFSLWRFSEDRSPSGAYYRHSADHRDLTSGRRIVVVDIFYHQLFLRRILIDIARARIKGIKAPFFVDRVNPLTNLFGTERTALIIITVGGAI